VNQSLKSSSLHFNVDEKKFDSFINKFLNKLNLQPIEKHNHESYKAVMESLEKFKKGHQNNSKHQESQFIFGKLNSIYIY